MTDRIEFPRAEAAKPAHAFHAIDFLQEPVTHWSLVVYGKRLGERRESCLCPRPGNYRRARAVRLFRRARRDVAELRGPYVRRARTSISSHGPRLSRRFDAIGKRTRYRDQCPPA